ncbi:TFIIH/NER complex subunit TFB3 [Sporobolomyces koalae]|uniref:TFIIH/NER complex subunit TFB3 n=1 Tax=Sporobolomyces koalae TaxID=500713 RepID=UPI0031770128
MSAPKPRFFLGKKATTTASRPSSAFASRASTPTVASSSKPPPPPPDHPIGSATDRRLVEYSSPDDVCPVCKNDRYLNPKLRLMVSKCYHKMCESCLDRLFSLGPEPCPVCGQTIRKNQFQPQMFENLEVQKEVAIRKRTAKIFNKQREDFQTEAAYNDYLEEYESITFSLIHSIGSDLAQTEAKIRSYELQNRQSIEENEERLERERDELERRERGEKEWRESEKRRYELEAEEDRKAKEDERKLVLEALESGNADADAILAAAKASSRKRSSARDSLQASSNPTDPSLKLKFLANLSHASLKAQNGGDAHETSAPVDIMADLKLYDAGEGLYDVLPRLSRAGGTPGQSTYAMQIVPSLVKEQDKEDQGGFVVEEVWEKCIRTGVVGLWDLPMGWQDGQDGQLNEIKIE